MSFRAVLGKRLLVAAVGVASFTVIVYILRERRRRRSIPPAAASAELLPIEEANPSNTASEEVEVEALADNSTSEVTSASEPITEEVTKDLVEPEELDNTQSNSTEEPVQVEMSVTEQNSQQAKGPAENGYKNAQSPSGTSTNSDGSADSGRATGGPNCSPHMSDFEVNPVYEFEVPNTLVGLIIGVQGKTISELCTRAHVKMLINPHHDASRYHNHQICSIEGPRANINKCLHMIRLRFPQNRFPDLDLKPVVRLPAVMSDAPIATAPQPSTLSLPQGVPCEVYVSSVVDAGHFFVQLPTHPTFSSLATLDTFTMSIYSQMSGIPVLPKPCNPGVVCVAPTANGWFRAITLHYEEEDDTIIVRLADYGGFLRVARSELRQIRSDLTSLPMQAIECYLAHVQPVDGTSHWSEGARTTFSKLCSSGIIHAELVGYDRRNSIPYVELTAVDENKKAQRVDTVLLDKGYAKPADPTRMVQLPPKHQARNSFVQQSR